MTTPLPMSRDEAIAVERAGGRLRFVHFWGHTPPRDGSVDASCFSQWTPSPFTVDGVLYRTCEHYMMAGKARLFGDGEMLAAILAVGHPREAKALGRKVRGFDQAVWEAERFAIVVDGNVAKFAQHDGFKAYLLGTRNRVLVEASPRDRIWGIGLGRDHPAASSPSGWRGLNLLGFALMAARERLS